ncbi:MAG TPA: hypothetical protein VLZ77_03095, partial [Acidimicrobiales bacterium]|nr:hypothetical protein [Acidimicrobiales bacterium]
GHLGAGGLTVRVVDRLRRRAGPLVAAALYVGLGLAYAFRWGSVVRHTPSEWISPDDLSETFRASVALAHGHLNAIYQSSSRFVEFPGILIVLVPFAALYGSMHTTFIEIFDHQRLVTTPQGLVAKTHTIWDAGTTASGAHNAMVYAVQPQWFAALFPWVLIVSCVALFALDALAERLGVPAPRRAVLCVAQVVVLWPTVVFYGHPEDPVALALALYALVFALDGRWTGAGWLFGAAMAFQPLVIVVFPILVMMAGRRRAAALSLRGALPLVALTVPSLAANLHTTVHDLATQPAFPDVPGTRQTPWTALAPSLGGRGTDTKIGGGPLRVATLVLAVVVAFWARRWRPRPVMLVWAVALALALRSYTESVMTPYYMWPALAVALVVAGRARTLGLWLAVALAVAVTVTAQWYLGVFAWWGVDVGGISALLAVSAFPPAAEEEWVVPAPSPAAARATGAGRARAGALPRAWATGARRAGQPPRGKGSKAAKRRKRPATRR